MATATRPFPDPGKCLLLGGVFTGVGGWELAAGAEWSQVFSAEIDRNARTVFEANIGRAPDVGDILTAPASSAKFAHVYTVLRPYFHVKSIGPKQTLVKSIGAKTVLLGSCFH